MPNETLTDAIDVIASGISLSSEQSAAVLNEIMSGAVSEVQTSAFLIALRTKGETVDELVGLAQTMRAFATKVDSNSELLDTAGTGGGFTTFNVSTAAALIAAASGAKVAKHGNRSATSLCGSADLLEALGARIDLTPNAIAQCIDEVGFGFMFAPQHHAATRFVVPVRKELGVRTIFNFLGPLTNPAAAKYQLIGVSDPNYTEIVAEALQRLDATRGLVVSSTDGLDEISISDSTEIYEINESEVKHYQITPEELGVSRASLDQLKGGGPEENATIVREIFGGEQGPRADLVVVNAAAALYIYGIADSIASGVEVARAAIESGSALKTLEDFVAKSNQLAD